MPNFCEIANLSGNIKQQPKIQVENSKAYNSSKALSVSVETLSLVSSVSHLQTVNMLAEQLFYAILLSHQQNGNTTL